MANRLASFKGPSAPSSSPVTPSSPKRPSQSKQSGSRQSTPAPASPSRQGQQATESTFHRKTRAILQDLSAVSDTWDELVLIDGLKAARRLVDARTELENDLAQIPNRMPRTRIVGPRLALMEGCIAELDAVVDKLRKQFRKMNTLVESLEALLIEAHKAKGWKWVSEEPLWVTWPLERFVTSVSDVLIPYHRSLETHAELVNVLRSHSLSFEESRAAISRWQAQPWVADDGWGACWEDLCEAEIDRW